MKRFLAMILALLMVLSLAACGNSGTNANTSDETPAEDNTPAEAPVEEEPAAEEPAEEEPAPVVEAEPIPEAALLHLSFEDAEGLTAKDLVDGAIVDSVHDILIAEGQGAVGNALYLDGKYGVDFDMVAVPDDSYTISFWYNADRVATYGPVVQVGRNISSADPNLPTTWINVTKSTWGTNSADIFPVAWNRNSSIGTEVSADGVWPWIYAMDDQEHGKREWCLLTIVADGNRYVADDGMERVGTQFYLNGELMWDANGDNMYYQGLAPEILASEEGLEGHIGINYWDTIYKGFIDELYVFDEALTPGQVKTLFEMGNPPESPVAPEYTAPEGTEPVDETEPEPLAAAPVDASAIDVLGTPERVLGFWSDTTDGYELADGATVTIKLNNYSDGVNNWDNFVLALTNTAVTTDLVASADNYPGYAEYAVLRADAFGWGDGAYNGTFQCSWGDDWAGWLALMTEAQVEVVLTRAGGEVTVNYTFTGADGTVLTETAVVTSTLTAEDPCYVHVTGEGAYIEILSVE